jgi:hypothetical protein
MGISDEVVLDLVELVFIIFVFFIILINFSFNIEKLVAFFFSALSTMPLSMC